MSSTNIPGSTSPKAPRRSHKLKEVVAQATASEHAIDLLLDLARGTQPEHPLVTRPVPRWAATVMEARG